MEPVTGKQLQEAIATHNTTLVSELGQYTCEGCGNEYRLMQSPIPLGPRKGEMVQYRRGVITEDGKITIGCICFNNEQAREAKQEQKQAKLRQLEKYNTVNANLEKVSFDNFDPGDNRNLQKAFITAKHYAGAFNLDEPANLFFAGRFGLGKSHLAYSICKDVRERGHTAVFVSMPKVLTMLKDTYNNRGGFTESELINVLSTVDLLVIDDIGAEQARKSEGETWATEKLFEIVDGRAGRHTVYTTNLASGELRKNVGERNFSRMMQGATILKFEGEDYRLKNLGF